MQVNSVSNFNFGSSRLMAHRVLENPQPTGKETAQPTTPQPEKPVENQGVTTSLYFTGKKDKNDKAMRNAAMAGLGSLIILAGAPSLTSCDTEAYAEAHSSGSDTAIANVNISHHPKGCTCPDCSKNRDTVYIHDVPDTVYINDTIKEPGQVVYVDTGSYHVQHDTVEKWIDNFVKPIPLDTLAKITDNFDIPTQDPSRRNIVNYQGIREWEYGNQFAANVNLLESSKNILVYDREDMDWKGNHTGWGKDVFRIPTSRFTIKTYDGKTINSPKGFFFETYTNPYDEKTSIYDNRPVQRYFCQTQGNKIVKVYSYDANTNLYREDGSVDKGYLNTSSKGYNILLKDLVASDPSIRWDDDPEYSTDDHLVGVKLVGVNDEELRLMYARQRDDQIAEQKYGTAR